MSIWITATTDNTTPNCTRKREGEIGERATERRKAAQRTGVLVQTKKLHHDGTGTGV
jgi:hypothetical protein